MAIETEIVARLKTHAGVSALAGSRVYPVVLPTDTAPAITYRRLSGTPEITLDGAVAVTSVQLEISAWGGTYENARDLADQIFVALDGYSTVDDVAMCHAQFGPDLYEPEVPDTVRWRCLVEVEVLAR